MTSRDIQEGQVVTFTCHYENPIYSYPKIAGHAMPWLYRLNQIQKRRQLICSKYVAAKHISIAFLVLFSGKNLENARQLRSRKIACIRNPVSPSRSRQLRSLHRDYGTCNDLAAAVNTKRSSDVSSPSWTLDLSLMALCVRFPLTE
jgi:hypothetical protein